MTNVLEQFGVTRYVLEDPGLKTDLQQSRHPESRWLGANRPDVAYFPFGGVDGRPCPGLKFARRASKLFCDMIGHIERQRALSALLEFSCCGSGCRVREVKGTTKQLFFKNDVLSSFHLVLWNKSRILALALGSCRNAGRTRT